MADDNSVWRHLPEDVKEELRRSGSYVSSNDVPAATPSERLTASRGPTSEFRTQIIKYGLWTFIALVILFALAFGKGIGRLVVDRIWPTSWKSVAPQIEAKLNADLPKTVNANVRLDRVEVPTSEKIVYYYFTLVNVGQIEQVRAAVESFRSRARIEICALDLVRRHKTAVGYVYRDNNEEFAAQIVVYPQDCGY